MIEVRDIHICFDRIIIENANLRIYPNEVTLLVGNSESGKTSLLNILDLLDNESQYIYKLNNNEIKDRKEIQRTSISYVFQDYNIIEDCNIVDNFKMMFNLSGRK